MHPRAVRDGSFRVDDMTVRIEVARCGRAAVPDLKVRSPQRHTRRGLQLLGLGVAVVDASLQIADRVQRGVLEGIQPTVHQRLEP